MSNRRIRNTRDQLPRLPPDFFNGDRLTEAQAGSLFHQCMEEVDKVLHQRSTSLIVKIGEERAQIHVLINRNGHLERFWLRRLAGNELLIVGKRSGLLPLSAGGLHGR